MLWPDWNTLKNPQTLSWSYDTNTYFRIEPVLGLKVDLSEDKTAGYPGVVCRKCCNLVETFYHFQVTEKGIHKTTLTIATVQKSVKEGQESLKTQVEERKKRDEEERLVTEVGD